MDTCVIWGNGGGYEKIVNQVKYEELKGNIKIAAVVAKKDEIFGSRRDGYLLIAKEELPMIEFDILIISSSVYYKEILAEAMALGIPENHIIDGDVFRLPLFDYGRYIRLVREPVTILSDDCGGGVYISQIKAEIHLTANKYILAERFLQQIYNGSTSLFCAAA